MISVLEGSGTSEDVFCEVNYIFDLEQHGGSHGGLVGVIDPRKDDSRASSKKAPTPLNE